MSYTQVIKDIEELRHYREWKCPQCNHAQQAYVLVIHAHCENCNLQVKLRGYASIGDEAEDVIDAVLAWLGQDREFELAMARKQIIDSS
jgi:transcription elongation factor Elf1